MAEKLTPRQQEILDFIRNSLEVLGAPPTRTEICSAFGFASPNAAGTTCALWPRRASSSWSRARRAASAWSSNSACR